MSNRPVVSIIMNCHNGQKFLSDAIQSVINQSFKNWELVFYDNFSKDKSYNILKKFKDKRIKYYKSKKFLNLYAARNQAVIKARGKYIAFLDTDDLWEKNKLKIQLNLIENSQFSMIYCNYYTLRNNIKLKRYKFYLPSGQITEKLLKKYFIGIGTVLIDIKAFKNLKFNNNYNIIGDFDFFIKISTKYHIGAIQKPLAFYRDHSSNLSKKKMKDHILELENWIKSNKKNFKKYKDSLKFIQIFIFKLKIKHFLQKLGHVVQW